MQTVTKRLVVDSRDRANGSSNSYIYDLEQVLHNIVSIQLSYAWYEKRGTQNYTVLTVDELATNSHISSNRYLRDGFCILPLTNYINELTTETSLNTTHTFVQPMSSLSKLTIRFLNHDGTAYDMREHLLVFSLSCYEYDAAIEHDSRRFPNVLDNSLIVLNLPQNFTKHELNERYRAMKRDAKNEHELKVLKKAYLDLVKRTRTRQ